MANVLGIVPGSALESSATVMYNSCMNMSDATPASRRTAFQLARQLHFAARNATLAAYTSMQRTITSSDCNSVWPVQVQAEALQVLDSSLWQTLARVRTLVDTVGFSPPTEQTRVGVQLRQAWAELLAVGLPQQHADLLLLERQMAIDVHLWVALRSLVSWSFMAAAVPYNASLRSPAEGLQVLQLAPSVSGTFLMAFGGLVSSHLVLAEQALQTAGSFNDGSVTMRQRQLLQLITSINNIKDRAVSGDFNRHLCQ